MSKNESTVRPKARGMHLLALFAALIAAVAIIGGCGSGGAGGEAEENVRVRVGNTGSSSDIGLFIADKKGYFEEQGLDVELVPFDSGGRMVAPLGAGQLEVAAGAPGAGLYNAIVQGVGLKIVADKGSTPPGYGYVALLVRKDLVDSGEFSGYEDLEGLTVANSSQGITTEVELDEALKKGGLQLDDIRQEYLGFPEHVGALENGAVDASITTEPSVTRAVDSGAAVRFAGTDEFYPDQQVATLLYGDRFIEDNPEAADKFMIAYVRALRDYNNALRDGKLEGPTAEEVISILTEYTPIKDPEIIKSMVPVGLSPDGELNTESMEKDLQFWKDQGYIEGEVAVDDSVDTSFAEAAVEELGPYEPDR